MGFTKIIVTKILILTCSIHLISNEKVEQDKPDYELYVDQIIKDFVKESYNKFEVNCIGSGGRMPNEVEGISVRFISNKKTNVDEARDLHVKLTKILIQLVNSHDKIKPYLREYPFTADRIKISIGFRKHNNDCWRDGSIAEVFNAKGKIYYFVENNKDDLDLLTEEPFELALKKIEEGSASL